jgi:adenosylcobinamide-phosphate synthase
MYEIFYVLALGVLIDRVFGEPPDRFHSTVWIGKLCEIMQKRLSNNAFHGLFLFLLVTLIPSIIVFFLLQFVGGTYLAIFLGGLILKLQFSWKGIADYTTPVLEALESDIEHAKEKLLFIVGRGTEDLEEEGILSATIESIGEGTNDGITAPLFYYVLFATLFSSPIGVAAAVFFRAASTLDSMVGYKKEGLDRIGLVSARADDIMNFFPSRVTAFFMILSSLILRENFKNAVRIFLRDRNKTISPNAGQPMAAMAGALGVKLEKPRHHILGEPLKSLQKNDVKRAIRISNLATVLFLFMNGVIIWQ